MRNKNTVFCRGNTEVLVDFSSEEISSDGAVVLLEKIEKKHGMISNMSKYIPDHRDPFRTTHRVEKLLNPHYSPDE